MILIDSFHRIMFYAIIYILSPFATTVLLVSLISHGLMVKDGNFYPIPETRWVKTLLGQGYG